MSVKNVPLLPILLALTGLLFAACSDERDTVARVVQQAADAAELKNIDGVMAYVAADYRDGAGRDRERIRSLISAQLRREERIAIAFRRLKVGEIADGRVAVILEAVLAEGDVSGKSLADVLPNSMGVWRFTLELERDDGGWLISRAEEQPLPPAAFLLGTP